MEVTTVEEIERMLRRAPVDGAAAAARRAAARAGAEGLVDVAYTTLDSPFGDLIAAATPRGLLRVSYEAAEREAVLEELAAKVSPRVLEAPERLDPVRRQLTEYFEGRRRRFEIPLDWSLTRGFFRRVLRETARLGYGEVATYKRLAAAAGSPRAVRAAGNALRSNPIPIVVPCHRVVRTGGGIGGYSGEIGPYTGGPVVKRRLLELEGALDERGRPRLAAATAVPDPRPTSR